METITVRMNVNKNETPPPPPPTTTPTEQFSTKIQLKGGWNSDRIVTKRLV